MAEVKKQILIQAPQRDVFEVIADFIRYPEFLTDHKEVRLISRDNNTVKVYFKIQIIKEFEYEVRHVLNPYNKIDWIQEKTPFKSCIGGWELIPVNDGKDTEVVYTIDLNPGFFIPKFIVTNLLDITLPNTLKAFKQRIERL